MTITCEFDYLKPKTLNEAKKLLAKHKKSQLLAGGTDLIGNLKEDALAPSNLIDLKGIKELKKLTVTKNALTIGALVTFSDLIASKAIKKYFPIIYEAALTVASKAIRNRATVVGNICSAVPCMDSSGFLMVYDTKLKIVGSKARRTIPIAKWFKGPRKTTLKKDEIVTSIEIKAPATKHAGCYIKLGRYRGEDLAQATVTVLATSKNKFRVSFGSVGPTPIRPLNLEKMLDGKLVDDKLIEEVMKKIPTVISPITDIRATKEYRTHMCQVMFKRALLASIARLKGIGPSYGTNFL
ncbi:MAG: xanthine dehydrogenase family protein subunit M [Bacteriovoracaceae bacterium]|nr:xanthine dehydrogenase family protein subunit M [Bacteriovoracaceae bacterium]